VQVDVCQHGTDNRALGSADFILFNVASFLQDIQPRINSGT
jgi:hypothetical protein